MRHGHPGTHSHLCRGHRRGTGPGKARATVPAVQSSGTGSDVEEGTGIGLVVAKRLVEWMGGSSVSESTVGKGSVFWIEMNLTAEPQTAASAADPPDVAPRCRFTRGAQLRTLLYVEDNPANLMLVEDLIARRPDMRLLTARDGIRGIEIARASQPDVDPDGHQPAGHQRNRGAADPGATIRRRRTSR